MSLDGMSMRFFFSQSFIVFLRGLFYEVSIHREHNVMLGGGDYLMMMMDFSSLASILGEGNSFPACALNNNNRKIK